MNIYCQLAKSAISQYLAKQILPDAQTIPPELLRQRAGCFVSLHSKEDELRGCIGTILPTKKNLAQEISSNAIEAAFHDPRFPPLQKSELDDIKICVDVLAEPEPIASEKSLDPKKYGVIIKASDGRTGLLLPDLEGVDDAYYQIAIARQKAGIIANEKVYLYRFTVERHKEA